MLKFVCCFPQP